MIRSFVLLLTCCCVLSDGAADEAAMVQFAGQTMGTTYSVKIFEPSNSDGIDDLRIAIDAVLRRVNDQMSTYLKSSEISRFNESDSTDWFDVSPEFAAVVETAQQVSAKTDGAFDITVGPLVNAWNFGPTPRTQVAPTVELIERLRESVGYRKLSVRREPPALKKSIPELKIDLSAIAKGHGVDRVAEFLNELGFEDVFVEIGGEVRTSGSKAGQWWKVGIQMPDAASDQWTIAHSLSTGAGDDQSMATSGDYRNFFEADGVRYSHTIDPRTGRPIEHNLASVSVVTERCGDADAWATALNVLGPDAGLEAAQREKLNALLISRTEDGFVPNGTGTLARYAQTQMATRGETVNGSPWATMAITTIAFATILMAMAVGVIFGRKAISGSCGGIANKANDDGSIACGLCSNPADACKELREKMQTAKNLK